MKKIKVCKGSNACGWSEDGHYECHCHMGEVETKEELSDKVKLEKVRQHILDAIDFGDEVDVEDLLKIIDGE